MPPKNSVRRHDGCHAGQKPAPQPMAEFRQTPTLVVIQTQSLPLKADLQNAILFAEERDHILLFTPQPPR